MAEQPGVLPLSRDELERLRIVVAHLPVDAVLRRLLATCNSLRMQAEVLARLEVERPTSDVART
jgi:hypothetical protein